jgi:hypothetical protein
MGNNRAADFNSEIRFRNSISHSELGQKVSLYQEYPRYRPPDEILSGIETRRGSSYSPQIIYKNEKTLCGHLFIIVFLFCERFSLEINDE